MDERYGTPGGKDDPVMGVHLEQIEKVDELLEALTRPVFSSEYQLARAQLTEGEAGIGLQQYMDLRGFPKGAEDDAIRELVKDSKPYVRKQKAMGNITKRMEARMERTGSPEKRILGIKTKMGERQKEALRGIKPDMTTAEAEEYGIDLTKKTSAQRGAEAREAMGLPEDKTIFEEKYGDTEGMVKDPDVPVSEDGDGDDGSADAGEGLGGPIIAQTAPNLHSPGSEMLGQAAQDYGKGRNLKRTRSLSRALTAQYSDLDISNVG